MSTSSTTPTQPGEKQLGPTTFVTTDTQTTIDTITRTRASQPLTVCHFVYFFSAHRFGLLKRSRAGADNPHSDYRAAITGAEYLLPDGIAIHLLWRRRYNITLPNLNGTDLIPALLDQLDHTSTNLVLYGADTPTITSVAHTQSSYPRASIQAYEGYSDRTPEQLLTGINTAKPTLLLVGRGSPRQETRIETHRAALASHTSPILVMSVGGLFDFIAGSETRAPIRVRRLRGERVRRALLNPRKNFHKSLHSLTLLGYLLRRPPLSS